MPHEISVVLQLLQTSVHAFASDASSIALPLHAQENRFARTTTLALGRTYPAPLSPTRLFSSKCIFWGGEGRGFMYMFPSVGLVAVVGRCWKREGARAAVRVFLRVWFEPRGPTFSFWRRPSAEDGFFFLFCGRIGRVLAFHEQSSVCPGGARLRPQVSLGGGVFMRTLHAVASFLAPTAVRSVLSWVGRVTARLHAHLHICSPRGSSAFVLFVYNTGYFEQVLLVKAERRRRGVPGGWRHGRSGFILGAPCCCFVLLAAFGGRGGRRPLASANRSNSTVRLGEDYFGRLAARAVRLFFWAGLHDFCFLYSVDLC